MYMYMHLALKGCSVRPCACDNSPPTQSTIQFACGSFSLLAVEIGFCSAVFAGEKVFVRQLSYSIHSTDPYILLVIEWLHWSIIV